LKFAERGESVRQNFHGMFGGGRWPEIVFAGAGREGYLLARWQKKLGEISL
jgi:hypothetical protein